MDRLWRLCVLAVLMIPLAAAPSRGAELEAAIVLEQFLAASQTGDMQNFGNWLATYALTKEQVERLIAAAQQEDSEERRNLLWHAVRCSRSSNGREYLLRNVVEDNTEEAQTRFVQSLTNLAPFDVPLLTALYQRTTPVLQEKIVQLALKDAQSLADPLSPRPEFIPERSTMAVGVHRTSQAQQAKTEFLMWIARNTRNEEHRLSVIEPALEDLDSSQQKQFARELLSAAEDPKVRARLIPVLCRRYAYDPYPLLVKSSETEEVKLAILEGLHMFGSSYGYSLGSISHGGETLQYVSQTDPSMAVRDAARRLLERINGKYGDRK